MSQRKTRIREWLLNKLHITRRPAVRVYNGYGDRHLLLLYGHVLRQSPLPETKFKKNFWSNSMSLLRLFMVEPFREIKVRMYWQGNLLETVTDGDGFFKFESNVYDVPSHGWVDVEVAIAEGKHQGVKGKGKVLVPHSTQYMFVSDIDDTFLVSHSASLRKRLYVLLTKNARTRRPFEGVVKHYQLLAHANTTPEAPNPFIYVSSSEWNLYDYVLEFKRSYGIPEGVYLLSQMKQWFEFLKTGQTQHSGKFMRISRLLLEFPRQQIVLFGDDTQQDPEIYLRIVAHFRERVVCVYLRHVGKFKKSRVKQQAQAMRDLGAEVCYFTKSEEAIEHSRSIGLIK